MQITIAVKVGDTFALTPESVIRKYKAGYTYLKITSIRDYMVRYDYLDDRGFNASYAANGARSWLAFLSDISLGVITKCKL